MKLVALTSAVSFLLTAGVACSETKLTLREDLVVGLDSLELGQVRDIAVDSRGIIYILDWGFETIWKLSEEGDYVGEIGRSGEGPGEMRRPLNITCGPDDKLYLGGQSKIIAVRPDGISHPGEIKRKFLDGRLLSIAANTEGVFVVAVDLFDQKVIHQYGFGGEYVRSFCDTYAVGKDVDTRAEKRYSGGHLCVGSDGSLYYAQNAPQLIKVFGEAGVLKYTHSARGSESPEPPDPIPLANGRMRYDMPVKTMGFVCLSDGGYIATLFFPPDEGTTDYIHYVDRYDASGNRLASRIETDAFWLRAVDSKNRIYVIEEREDVPVVVRYRLD